MISTLQVYIRGLREEIERFIVSKGTRVLTSNALSVTGDDFVAINVQEFDAPDEDCSFYI